MCIVNIQELACKNIATGKYFLFIEERDDGKLLLVIPSGEIKPLDASLFKDIEEINIAEFIEEGLLNQKQIYGFKKFVEYDSVRLFKEIMGAIENSEDLLDKIQVAKKQMSKMQFEFVIKNLSDQIKSMKD